jgi:hypothetical protein
MQNFVRYRGIFAQAAKRLAFSSERVQHQGREVISFDVNGCGEKKTKASVLKSEPIKSRTCELPAVQSLIGQATSTFGTEPHERASLHQFGRHGTIRMR